MADDVDVLMRYELQMLEHLADVVRERRNLEVKAAATGGWWVGEWEEVTEAEQALRAFAPRSWWTD